MEMPAEMSPQTPINGIPNEDVNEVLLDIQMTIGGSDRVDIAQNVIPIMLECNFDRYDKYIVVARAIQSTCNKLVEKLGGKVSMYTDFPDEPTECRSSTGSHEFEVRSYDKGTKELIIGCTVCNEEYMIKGAQ